ncbi:MAG: response regulator [Candidatus Promineifilaceae bacterium]|nr:response regulator [Candidatus Promineifilaceae bacterium]
MKNPTNVLVVIDQTIERKGLSHLLNALPPIVVIGEAADGQEAVQMACESRPDVIIFNQELFQKDGPDPIWRIWQDNPGTGILVLSNNGQDELDSLDYKSAIVCFAPKNAAPEVLAQVIQAMT